MKICTAFKYSLVGLLFCSIVPNELKAVSDSDLQKVEQQVKQQSLEHKKLQAQATQINMELASVSQEMIKEARHIQNNEEKLSRMENQLEKLKEELAEAEAGFSQEDDNLIKTLAALENLALKPTEALLVQPLTPVDIIRSAMLLRETQKKDRVEKQFEQISKQKSVLEKEHARMKKLVQRKSKIRNMVEIRSEKAKKNADKLAAQARDLRDLLAKLEQQRLEKKRKEEARRLAEEKAREKQLLEAKKTEQKQTAGLQKKSSPIINTISSGFAKAKGTLPLPARGKIVTAYGEQVVKGVTSKGLILRTRNDAQVIAPFDGSVIFAGPFRGYGNLIIIEHGDGYLSLLAGLKNFDVEVGQMLLAGEPVGQMPDEGDAKLYVEIRKDNQPVDPMAWMRL